jgi:primosomal protein N' (replication factor Y)
MQVAGRAGRSSSPGEVYLQIYNRDNDVFKHLLHGDYGRFYHEEMLSRTELRYPPASKLVKIEFTSPSESIAEQAATAFLARLQPHLAPEQGSVLGPAPAGIARIKGRYRFHLLLKLFGFKPPALLIRQIQQEITGAFRQGKTSVFIDVDPQNLL